MNEHDMNLATSAGAHLVPAGFAEKAMASLMQLHHELVAEKEKRVQLYRTLMQKEQSLAELAMYVRVLEERLGQGASATAGDTSSREVLEAPVAAAKVDAAPLRPAPTQAPAAVTHAPVATTTRAPAQPPRRATEGWKTW